MTALHSFLFNVFPYICLAVFLIDSLARFDRDQYTWKSDSSQLLRGGQLRRGSNLFHIGILFLFFGHAVGLLTPHFVYAPFISAETKQLVAVSAGGVAGVVCFIGLSLLLHRRIFDPRIHLTSHRTDLAILLILWVQLGIGLITLPYSFGHKDAGTMHAGRYALGELVQMRHVLFAVTPGVDVNAQVQRAEACLLDLRCARPPTDGGRERFDEVAASTSNCPSGAHGGDLGWLRQDDCAPELVRELFGQAEIGVLPRLVHSRFGLHVVEVQARRPGLQPAFEAVRSAVAQALRQQSFATALRQYLQLLAGQARVDGVDLDAAASPLVQ